ncbi:tetratricopeptide repeat protein [Marinicella sp. S1101]|uniref:tetratricopeptide repeat protein n=1 Tax=Marinicella marina TaxID=2996016 RepID=UPI002260D442|nr:tetratricopeptide repeat protein [Marinicella marina]MCX7552718.1 tetratricopeptide repeat protein [Marinicella marina]MDJ1139973.1 tetratricopeptide repeat protein [Marinicella marina]
MFNQPSKIWIIFTALSLSFSNQNDIDINQIGEQGIELYQSEEYALALKSFDQILKIKKNNFQANLWKAYCLEALEKYSESIAFYSIAIEIKPSVASTYFNRAVLYQKTHAYHLAEKDYLLSLENDPTNQDVIPNDNIYNNLGSVYSIQENYDKAVIAFMNATRINKKFHEAHFNLGLAQEARGAFKSALSSYEKALNLAPNNFEYQSAYIRLALTL